jgi:hypothetical protein
MNPIKQYSTRTHKDKDERHEPLGSCSSSLVLCVLVEYCLIGFMSLIFSFMCSRWVLFDWVHVAHLYLYVFSLSIVWLGSCRSSLVLCVLVEYCLIGFMSLIKQYSTRTHKAKNERHEPNQTILNKNT